MNRLKRGMVLSVILFYTMTVMLTVTPAYAFSVTDLLGQAVNNQTAATNASSGKGIFENLISLLLGKLWGNTAGNAVNGSNHNGDFQAVTEKEFVGFYAEWWGEDSSSYNSMIQNAQAIKTIAPFWATLQADGTITDRGGNDHAAVVDTAHQKNIKVLLLVNNAKQDAASPPIQAMLANPKLRAKAIDNFEAYIKKFKLDGINIDFEIVPAEDRANLTAFMRELSARFKPQGYIVSIDVFPKQNETNDIAAAYDYAELAKYADKIMIMTYDNHGMWSEPGPIAGIAWVENSLQYALKFIPKNKLYLGLAAYGYDWSTQGTQSLAFKEIMELAQRYGQAIQWDDVTKAPYFNYVTADGIKHTVWFENAASLQHKLALISKYDIAGAAMWKLGEEDPQFWSFLQDTFHK